MLRHFWIVSGWHRYFWISVPLKHHYKKCPVMWTIIKVITKNPEISVSSRNNPEMSQHSSDVPMLVNFSIYIFPWDLLWTGLYRWKYYFSIHYNAHQMSETFKKSQMSELFDISAGWSVEPSSISDRISSLLMTDVHKKVRFHHMQLYF